MATRPEANHQLDRAFHALADPTRRVMVERLAEGPASVGELATPLVMSLPAVLQHLRVLEFAGLARSEKLGRVRSCHLDRDGLRLIDAWLRRLPGG